MKMSLFCIVSLAAVIQFASAQDVQRQMIRTYAPDLRFIGRVPLGLELNTETKTYEAIGGQLSYMTGTPLFLHLAASLPLSSKGLRDYDALVGCMFWNLSGIADVVTDQNINHESELLHDREFWAVRAGHAMVKSDTGGGSLGFRFMGTFDISVPISNTIEVGVRPYFGGSYLRDSIGWYFLN